MAGIFKMSRYSQADTDGHNFAFRYQLPNDEKFIEAVVWCSEIFGIQDAAPVGSRWMSGNITIWFRDERDAFQFKLRWC